MTRQYGIIGYPLGHSLSPLVHNWGFGRFGIAAEYVAWPMPPEDLPAFMDRFRSTPFEGASVTIPHKSAVMAFVDGVTDLGQAVGAVNTLCWRDGVLWGENTDVEGFCRPLVNRDLAPRTALVLGCGGAARAAVVGLTRLGVSHVAVTSRTDAKAEALAREFGIEPVPWATRATYQPELLVNTTPLGMSGRFEDLSPYPGEALTSAIVVYDLVYNPYHTVLVKAALAAGGLVIPGLEMFLYQAVEQFRLWTGRVLPEEELRSLVMEALYGT